MKLFREVVLPNNTAGRLVLHSMPGRNETIDDCWTELKSLPVHSIVCLTSDEEISKKSPSYSASIASGSVPCERWPLSVPDYGVPENESEFLSLASRVAESLKSGQNVLVHCGAGIGRTGTFATLVLMRLRVPIEEALQRVSTAKSGPETSEQRAFLERMRSNTDGYAARSDVPPRRRKGGEEKGTF
jgi:protein-tyrosine phosphatase